MCFESDVNTCRSDEPIVPLRRRKPGRPRLADETQEVSLLLPVVVFDLCCREAHARSVPLAVVFREAIIHSRRRRGEM